MTALDFFWHLANFFLPAWGVAVLMASLVKLIWRHQAKAIPWRMLAGWGALGGSLAAVAGLLLLGRDGSIAGYGVMLAGVVLPQWGLLLRH